MRQLVFLLLFIAFYLTSFAQKSFTFSINGNVRGLGSDSIFLFIRHITKPGHIKIDTLATKSKDDKFSIHSKRNAICDAQICFGGLNSRKRLNLFIEKGTIEVSGDINSFDNIKIIGTPGNNDYNSNKNEELKYNTEIIKLSSRLSSGDIENIEIPKVKKRIDELRDSIKANRIRFISVYGNSPVSAIYLYVLQDYLSIDDLERFYTSFSTAVKSISYLAGIPEKIKARKATILGADAPDFITKDLSGRDIKLSDFRGRYVLIEFWASWCVPCRKENPALNKALDTFEKNGFSIIGVSLDDNKSKWINAIAEDSLRWVHASELNGFNNQIAKLYGVQPIPDNFLISPEGRIIARHLSGEDLILKLSKEFLNR